jgi:hypothetical protein
LFIADRIVNAVVPFMVNSCMTPQQEAAEREIIFAMITMLRDLRDAGHRDLANSNQFSRELAHGSGQPAEDAQAVGGRCETEAQRNAPDADNSLSRQGGDHAGGDH